MKSNLRPAIRAKRQTLSAKRCATLLALLLLTGCARAAPGSLQDTVQRHTVCPATTFIDPLWMPDGASLIYTSGAQVLDIHQVNLDGSGDRVLVGDAILPALSSDGAALLFARRAAQGGQGRDFSLLDLVTGQEQIVIHGADAASWSPVGREIMQASVAQDFGTLTITGMDGGGVFPLTDLPIPGMQRQPRPIWSPDGEWIAFDGTVQGVYRAMIISVDGGEPLMVEPPDDGRCPAPIPESDSVQAWLPDGSGLVISRVCSVSLGVMVADPYGEVLDEMPDVKAENRTLEWSDDGARMLYVERVGGIQQVMSAAADGSDVRVLHVDGWDAHWSPGLGAAGDGSRIAFVGRDPSGLQGIFIMSAQGDDLRQIVHDPSAGQVCLR